MIYDDARIVNQAPSKSLCPQSNRDLVVYLRARPTQVHWDRDSVTPVHTVDALQHIDFTSGSNADVMVTDKTTPS
jgi:hypothetical protein